MKLNMKMEFLEDHFYHIYNRTNNSEILFRDSENYLFFLKKYRQKLEEFFDTLAYCLMPTHFHFLIQVKHDCFNELSSEKYSNLISKQIGIVLRSYTRAYNNYYGRHGNLFNQRTSAKLLCDDKYCNNLIYYIHQNPLRSNLVEKAEDWNFSSFKDYIGIRNGTLPNKDLICSNFSKKELIEITNSKFFEDSNKYYSN